MNPKTNDHTVRNLSYQNIYGVVLKKTPFGEGHGQYRLLDREKGVVEFAAFGASKENSRRRNALLTGSLISGVVRFDRRRQGFSLSEARLENGFENIHKDFTKMAYLMLILETLDTILAPDVPFERFESLAETLKIIDGERRIEKYALVFVFGTLRAEGVFPEYSPKLNDIVLEFHDPDFRLGNGTMRFLADTEKYPEASDWTNREIATSVIVNLVELLNLAIHYHYGKKLASVQLVGTALDFT